MLILTRSPREGVIITRLDEKARIAEKLRVLFLNNSGGRDKMRVAFDFPDNYIILRDELLGNNI